ncbi:MAG: tetratricopeptide repeat protein [Kiritimatiellaeota bacterium]|nr:tetratricopeptide repeat protein [Kiritimatiellota bacterium]
MNSMFTKIRSFVRAPLSLSVFHARRSLCFFCFLLIACLVVASCGKREFESNDAILRKAIMLAVEKGDWQNARILAFKAVNQNGKDANARIVFALTLEQSDELDRAVEEIKQAVFIDADNFMAQYSKGRLLFKSESYEDCPDPLENANRLKPNVPQVLSLLARSYALLGVNDKAIKNFVALAKIDGYGDRLEIYNELGVLFYKKNDYARAVRFFRKALSLNENSPPVNLNLGVLCDTLCFSSKKLDKQLRYAKISEKYYLSYLKLVDGNPNLKESSDTVVTRIKKLRNLHSIRGK